jgi:hypothetical protein
MNERLEAFRKRLRGPDKEKGNWQFWIGSPTAWLALLLSSTTAFYTFLYHSDELSVVIDSPSIVLDNDGKLAVHSPSSVTFINSGSRPVAVTGIQLILVQPIENFPDPQCRGSGSYSNLSLEFEQTVVKPYDAVAKPLGFYNKKPLEEEKVELTKENTGKGESVLAVCLKFSIAATDAAGWIKTIDLGKTTMGRPGFSTSEDKSEDPPAYLIKRNRFWTEVDRDGLLFSAKHR